MLGEFTLKNDPLHMMLARQPKQSWWMTFTEGPKEKVLQPKRENRETKKNVKNKLKATGDHGRPREPRETTGGHGRQREATGGHGRQREATRGNARQREATRGNERQRETTGGDGTPREATGGHGRQREATGGNERQREATRGHWRPREATGGNKRQREATGGNERQREATGNNGKPRGTTEGNGRPREATGGRGRPREATGSQFPRTGVGAARKSNPLTTLPGPLKATFLWGSIWGESHIRNLFIYMLGHYTRVRLGNLYSP